MSNNINESLQMKEAEQKNQFFQQGFATYFDVVKALHLFQTEVGNEIAGIIQKYEVQCRIKTAMKLEDEAKQVNQHVWPSFPDNIWSYNCCQIFSRMYLGKPEWATLYIGVVWCVDNNVKLFCALEGKEKYKLDRWLGIFPKTHPKNYEISEEQWNRHAIVMYRHITSPDNLKNDLEELLDDFLKCFEASQNPNIPPAGE